MNPPNRRSQKVAHSLFTVQRDTGALVVPVAVVYYDLISRPPLDGLREDYLWRPKDIHQNLPGTAVNAWTLYAVLAGRSPVDLDLDYTQNLPDWLISNLAPDDLELARDKKLGRAMRERVWKIVQDWQNHRTEFDDQQ